MLLFVILGLTRMSHLLLPTRRQFLLAGIAAGGVAASGCGRHVAQEMFPGVLADFTPIDNLPLPTLQIGAAGPGVVVLHELPGLTKDDLALARGLSRRGFRVYVPVLFGKPEMDNFISGYQKACGGTHPPFNCSDLSARSPILDKLAPLCEAVARRSTPTIGAIGMCLSGILPLALLSHGVDAAVLCQPTVPFSKVPPKPNEKQAPDLGLGQTDLDSALKSSVPFLLVHYVGDELCPPERVREIRKKFTTRVATIDLTGSHHSSLASDFDNNAFEDAVTYLKVRLGSEAGPRPMRAAKLADRACAINADRVWQTN
ncbi:MAG TPA: dienelactone hydrolase family protein [Vicinamibacterales bacterium]|nr:dienelactone hydrolase family protein [Vicinamibacterales bacterium]